MRTNTRVAAPAAGGILRKTAKISVGMERRLWSCCSSQRRNYGNLLYPGDKMMAPVQIKAEDRMEGGWQGGVGLQPGMGPRVSLEGTD